MRLAHITTSDLSLRLLLFKQLLAFKEAGFEVYGVSAPGPWVREIEDAGISHVPVPHLTRGASLVDDLKALLELYRVFRRHRFDIVHLHTPKGGFLGKIAARLARVPLIVNTIHGLYGMKVGATGETIYSLRNPWMLLEAASMKLSDFEFSQNSEDLEWLRSEGWLSPRSSMFLGNGVDVDLFSPSHLSPDERRILRAKYEIPEESVVVGTAGRLVWEKGYREFFQAAARLKARYPGTVFLSAGPSESGKKDAIGDGVVERYASSGIVRFLGMQRDMNEIYSLMDVFALPSHREGFPRSAMEAASKGLPLVLTDIRGCREVVEHEYNGLLVPVREAGALERALESLITNEDLRTRMGRASRAKATAEFDERQVIRKTLEVYRRFAFAQSPMDRSPRITTSGEGDLAPLLPARSKLD